MTSLEQHLARRESAALSRSCLARVWSCWCGTTLHRREDLGERAWLARIADHTHHCKEARA